MNYIDLFKMPKPIKITARSSSITNAFINSIIPVIAPTNDDVKIALNILGMDLNTFHCSYCGDTATEWDHLRPLVENQKPTGFISEIQNLVPSCGKCNQSKGNRHWAKWILSNAKLSPKTRNSNHLELRMTRLEEYELWRKPTQLDFESIIGKEKWEQHWENWDTVISTMKHAQNLATEIKLAISNSHYSK